MKKDIKIGDTASFSKTVTESDVYGFAGITGDFNTVHINKIEAEKSIFGKQICHGMLIASFISTVLGMYLPGEGTIYLSQNVKFVKPVYIGDTITAEVTVIEMFKGDKVRLETIVKNQNLEIVVMGEAVVKI